MTTPWQVSGYTPVRELGTGASGSVVLAQYNATGQSVAIKYLSEVLASDPTFLANFRAEARLLTEVDDPNVIRLYEYVQSGANAAIVLELVDGVTLRALLAQSGALTPEAALVVLKGSLLGLAAAHEHGITHRDYKPENVMVDGTGATKLIDFGVATRSGRDGQTAGTPDYMAPELWDGGPASPAGDVYAATAVLVECLTGAPAFAADTADALRLQHLNAPPPVQSVPEPVRGLVKTGMAKDPQDRPSTAREFVDALDAAATGAYGEEWEQRGRRELARLALLLAAFFPLAGTTAGGLIAFALTILGRRRVLAGAAVVGAAVIGATTVAVATPNHHRPIAGPPVLSTLTVGPPAATDSVPPGTTPPHASRTTPVAPPPISTSAPPTTVLGPPPISTSVPRTSPLGPPPISTPPVPPSVFIGKEALNLDPGNKFIGDVFLTVSSTSADPVTIVIHYSDGTSQSFVESAGSPYTLTPTHTFPMQCLSGPVWTITVTTSPTATNQGKTSAPAC